jgi:hypothetical protein
MAQQTGTKTIIVDGREVTVRVFAPGKARHSESVSDIETELNSLRIQFWGWYKKRVVSA